MKTKIILICLFFYLSLSAQDKREWYVKNSNKDVSWTIISIDKANNDFGFWVRELALWKDYYTSCLKDSFEVIEYRRVSSVEYYIYGDTTGSIRNWTEWEVYDSTQITLYPMSEYELKVNWKHQRNEPNIVGFMNYMEMELKKKGFQLIKK